MSEAERVRVARLLYYARPNDEHRVPVPATWQPAIFAPEFLRMADAIIADQRDALAAERARAIEECAAVAKAAMVQGQRAGDRADLWDYCCRRIATAIRALLPETPAPRIKSKASLGAAPASEVDP